MTFTSNIGYTRINNRGITAGNLTGSALGDALFMDPTMDVYDPEGKTIQNYDRDKYGEPIVDKVTGQLLAMPSGDFNELANPLARLSRNQNGKNNSDKIIANLNLEVGIWDNLKYKFSWGSDLAFWGYDTWGEPAYLNKNATRDNSSVNSQMNRGYRWQIENVLYYDKTFGKHSFNVVLGQSAQRSTSRSLNGTRFDLPEYLDNKANIDFAIGLATDGRMSVSGGFGDPSSLASYFGRQLQLCRALHDPGHCPPRRLVSLRLQQQVSHIPLGIRRLEHHQRALHGEASRVVQLDQAPLLLG